MYIYELSPRLSSCFSRCFLVGGRTPTDCLTSVARSFIDYRGVVNSWSMTWPLISRWEREKQDRQLHRNMFEKRAFSHAAPWFWNEISVQILYSPLIESCYAPEHPNAPQYTLSSLTLPRSPRVPLFRLLTIGHWIIVINATLIFYMGIPETLQILQTRHHKTSCL